MKGKIDLAQRAALHIELPGEPIPGMPLIEIYGNCRVLIENHKGVKSYSCSQIAVCTSTSDISVLGDKLDIASMTKHRLVITGEINSVLLSKGR